MKLRVRTYFGEPQKNRWEKVLAYIFNLIYRTVIPVFIFYTIMEWGAGLIPKIFLCLLLGFFAFYQFTWEVR